MLPYEDDDDREPPFPALRKRDLTVDLVVGTIGVLAALVTLLDAWREVRLTWATWRTL